MNKRIIFFWSLYDFANSIAVVAFYLYFSQWLVVDMGVSDFWYNIIFVGATVLLLFTAPVAGAIADKQFVRMWFLRVSTVLFFMSALAAALLAVLGTQAATIALLAGIAYMIANYFYQFSLTFYNSLLTDIAPSGWQGFISGVGQSSNWLGQIVGILICLPFVNGIVHWFGHSGRTAALLPATLIFFILSLPLLIGFKDQPKIKSRIIGSGEYKNLFRNLVRLCKAPGVGRYLLSFFLFNDAILTLQNNFSILLNQLYHISDTKKSLLLLAILVTAALGAFISGFVADRLGLKKTLLIIVGFWIAIFPSIGLAPSFVVLAAATILMGFFYGSTWTVSRAVMVCLAPANELNRTFSYYSLAERFSTFLGPLVWGLITTGLLQYGSIRYRISIISMTLFIIAGFIVLRKIPDMPRDKKLL